MSKGKRCACVSHLEGNELVNQLEGQLTISVLAREENGERVW